MQIIPLGLLLASAMVAQQTQVELKGQSKKVDFSGATTTKPIKTGNAVPGSCAPGEMFFNLSSTPGQNLFLCTASGWSQLTTSSSGSSSGGGATSASSLTDLAVTQTSATVLNIGGNCTNLAPCNIRFGNRTYPIIGGATVTLSSNTVSGTAYIYVTTLGTQAVLTVGNTMGVTCSGCTAVDGIIQFPPDSIPLATWTSTLGQWDPNNGTNNGGIDLRAFLSNKSVIGGMGIVTAEVVGQTVVSADTSVIGIQVAVPATAAAPCSQGMYAFDTSYFYQCVASNTWRRVAISAW